MSSETAKLELREDHLKILRAARDGTLPRRIRWDCVEFSFDALHELVEAGLMAAELRLPQEQGAQQDERGRQHDALRDVHCNLAGRAFMPFLTLYLWLRRAFR